MKWPEWTGLGERTYSQAPGELVQPSKTAWDWLQLLIVPAVLAGAVTIYNQLQTNQANTRQTEQAAEDRRQASIANQDTIFENYVSQMSVLMVSKRLLTSRPNSPVSKVGQILTAGFLSAMDGPRRGDVVRFLFRAGLLGNPPQNAGQPPGAPLVSLESADLHGADLAAAHVVEANLTGADLTGADLSGADLATSNLNGANLENANLSHAILTADANLVGADLRNANLSGASLVGIKLTTAYLNDANLSGADLTRADLTGAILTGAILRGATFNHTTCPDGRVTNTRC
jgi:hypothetical protein